MNLVEILNTVFFVWFVAGLGVSLFYVGRRIIDYVREKIYPPLLAFRDAGLLAGLSIPFLLILIARAFDWIPTVTGTLWWTLLTALPAVAGVTQFAIIERFIIEKKDSRGYKKVMTEAALRLLQEQAEDKDFGDKRRDLEMQHIKERNGRSTN